jgi:hypothetical protein
MISTSITFLGGTDVASIAGAASAGTLDGAAGTGSPIGVPVFKIQHVVQGIFCPILPRQRSVDEGYVGLGRGVCSGRRIYLISPQEHSRDVGDAAANLRVETPGQDTRHGFGQHSFYVGGRLERCNGFVRLVVSTLTAQAPFASQLRRFRRVRVKEAQAVLVWLSLAGLAACCYRFAPHGRRF